MSGGVPLKGAPIPGRSARPLLPAGGALVRSAGNTIGSAPGLAALPAACSRGDSGARKAAPDRRSRSATDDSEIVAIRSGDHSDRGLYANQGEGSNHGHQVSRRGSRVPHRAGSTAGAGDRAAPCHGGGGGHETTAAARRGCAGGLRLPRAGAGWRGHFFSNDPATTEIYTLSLHGAASGSDRARRASRGL